MLIRRGDEKGKELRTSHAFECVGERDDNNIVCVHRT
jgi:hypothetical protein